MADDDAVSVDRVARNQRELAEACGVQLQTVRVWMRRPDPPPRRADGHWDVDSVLAWRARIGTARVRQEQLLDRVAGDPADGSASPSRSISAESDDAETAPVTAAPTADWIGEDRDGVEVGVTVREQRRWETRYRRARALAAELEVRRRRGELVEAAEVEGMLTRRASAFRQSLLGLCRRMAPVLAPPMEERDVEARLRTECRAILQRYIES